MLGKVGRWAGKITKLGKAGKILDLVESYGARITNLINEIRDLRASINALADAVVDVKREVADVQQAVKNVRRR